MTSASPSLSRAPTRPCAPSRCAAAWGNCSCGAWAWPGPVTIFADAPAGIKAGLQRFVAGSPVPAIIASACHRRRHVRTLCRIFLDSVGAGGCHQQAEIPAVHRIHRNCTVAPAGSAASSSSSGCCRCPCGRPLTWASGSERDASPLDGEVPRVRHEHGIWTTRLCRAHRPGILPDRDRGHRRLLRAESIGGQLPPYHHHWDHVLAPRGSPRRMS